MITLKELLKVLRWSEEEHKIYIFNVDTDECTHINETDVWSVKDWTVTDITVNSDSIVISIEV